MAAEGDNIIQFTFTGEDGELVPDDATHVTVDESVIVIPARAFAGHPNIVEAVCRNAERIEREAFLCCPCLRLVKIPGVTIVERGAFSDCKALTDVECDKVELIGELAFSFCESLRSISLPSVKIVERSAFMWCEALTHVECDKLERIGWSAFNNCPSLRSISLPSVNIVEESAFRNCVALTDVKFGDELETIGGRAFNRCTSLERITLPLKDGVLTADEIFQEGVFQDCENLKHVDLVGGVHEFVDALPLDDWKNDMNAEINSINQILPTTPAGDHYDDDHDYVWGLKAQTVREWIRSVLRKIVDYKQQHRDLLTAATSILIEELALPQDIVINNVLPFLELPSCNWKDDKWHGWGKMMYDDGRVYFGNWKDDKKHGWGEMTYADGNVFEGNWVDDKRHGGGKMTFAWGDVYEGNFVDDKMHGWGEMTYADGRVYLGHWKDGFELEEGEEDEE